MWSKLIRPVALFARRLVIAYQKMNREEKGALLLLILILFLALFLKIRGCFLSRLELVPAQGGIYREGVVGEPKLINPLLATNEAEKSLVKLVYQGLYQYDWQGRLIPQLAEKMTWNKNRDRYLLRLKKGLRWADGQEITVRDIKATIRLIKEKEYQGPWQGRGWQDVKLKIIGQRKIQFQLLYPNLFFKQLLTLPILPAHIANQIEPEKLTLHEINQKPVSSGPYQIDNIIFQEGGAQVLLSPNPNFNGERPYISKLVIFCYPDYQAMLGGLKKGQVAGISFIQPPDWQKLDQSKVQLRKIRLPQITAGFFNLKNKHLKQREIRKALTWAIDREEIIREVLKKQGIMIDGPLPILSKEQNYYPKASKKILKRLKKKKISFSLITSQDTLQALIAEKLKEQWQKIGIRIRIETLSSREIGLMVQTKKDYDILLFGQNLGPNLDLFSFWHSSQIKEGFNLSQLKESRIDQLLEESEIAVSYRERRSKLRQAAELIKDQYPALFLFSPNYLHLVPADIKGLEEKAKGTCPEDRFFRIEDWYLKEKRQA